MRTGIVNIEANMIGTFASASYPSYVAKSWHTVLIMYAVLAVLGLLNMYLFWVSLFELHVVATGDTSRRPTIHMSHN